MIGVYVIPDSDEPPPGAGCADMTVNFTTQEVPCGDLKPDWEIPAGERRWMPDESRLPVVFEGGCSVVTVEYDQSTSVVTSAECNLRA